MTSAERMKRWRENPENRAQESKRRTAWRREHGVKPQVRLTPDEKIVLKRIAARRCYAKMMADPVRHEKRNAYYRVQYAAKKAKAEHAPVSVCDTHVPTSTR